jgi:uncharacterized protein YndB with AHSA1/START domain
MSDERKTRNIEIEIELMVSPERLWRAITEAEEIVRWFAPEAKVEPGPGGSIGLSWGPGMEGKEPILIWEPGKHLRVGSAGTAGSPKVVDYHIETRGGKTVLRLVHSGFEADGSFDDEYDSTSGGWALFLAMLKYGLDRFPESPARNVTSFRFLPLDEYGRFAWIMDPEGNRVELWEPAAGGEPKARGAEPVAHVQETVTPELIAREVARAKTLRPGPPEARST